MVLFIQTIQLRQILRERFADAQDWEWEQASTAEVHKGSFWDDGNVLKLDCRDGCTTR